MGAGVLTRGGRPTECDRRLACAHNTKGTAGMPVLRLRGVGAGVVPVPWQSKGSVIYSGRFEQPLK